jgi:hypothetical protein
MMDAGVNEVPPFSDSEETRIRCIAPPESGEDSIHEAVKWPEASKAMSGDAESPDVWDRLKTGPKRSVGGGVPGVSGDGDVVPLLHAVRSVRANRRARYTLSFLNSVRKPIIDHDDRK